MTLRTFLSGKIHGIRLTDKSVHYQGSITVSPEYLDGAGIAPYEAVQVVNVQTGARLTTYVIPTAEPGKCILNGGAARLAEVGDTLIIMAFVQCPEPIVPQIVLVGANNRIQRVLTGGLALDEGLNGQLSASC